VPCLEGREREYATEAIEGGWLAAGPFIERFERAIADYTGAAHAVALANGTAALHLALLAAGVGSGDLVLAPTLTFAASANAIKYCGADPVFFDVDAESWGIDARQLRQFLERECVAASGGLAELSSGRRIAAILPVDVYGHPVDMDALKALAAEFGLAIVEDAAEALGAEYKGRRLGGGARFCCLSFNGNKVITGGNGGMVLTDDEQVASRVRYLATQARDDRIEFVHGAVGFNYRMPNINAAVALAQSERLGEFVQRKRRIVEYYQARFGRVNGIAMWREAGWARSSHWMAILTVDETCYPGALPRLQSFVRSRGIEARPVWSPLHRQAPFSGGRSFETPVADRLSRSAVCLPCSAGLTEGEREIVADAVIEFFARDGR
jgi:perosamine synthetase